LSKNYDKHLPQSSFTYQLSFFLVPAALMQELECEKSVLVKIWALTHDPGFQIEELSHPTTKSRGFSNKNQGLTKKRVTNCTDDKQFFS
jgi:hypothetical protein